jgi:outer membrane protein assembly factor BamB
MFRHDLSHTGRTPFTGPAAPDVKWTFTADDGIASSPAIAADGTLYVGAGWYFDGTTDTCLYAINPDGSLKWRYRARGGIFSSPAIGPNGMVYFSSLQRIYALEDAGTYWDIKWQYSLGTWLTLRPP